MSDVGEDPALIGRTIAGKFVIEKFLGGGAMGAVYRAHQTSLDKTVAVKVMHREVATDEQFAARFQREARAASKLNHPNSMGVIDFGQEPDGLLYIAMEYLQGRDLYKVIHEDWPIGDQRIVDLLSQALAAIAVAHDMGVIHRDLKPENIMILRGRNDEGADADVVKVCDFGIAKIQEAEGTPDTPLASTEPSGIPGAMPSAPVPTGKKLTTQGLVVGTPEYMSPEQARGEKLDARSDLYSMGVILYQLLTGRTPFTGDNALAIVLKHITEQPQPPRAIYAGVNSSLEAVCLKAMAKNTVDRFQTAREMRAALRSALEAGTRPTPVDATAPTIGSPISAPAITAAETAPTMAAMPASTTNVPVGNTIESPPKKKRSLAPLLIAFVVLASGGAAAALKMSKKKPDYILETKQTPSPAESSAKNDGPAKIEKPPASIAVTTAAPISPDPATPNDVHNVKHTSNGPAKGHGKPTGPGAQDTAVQEPIAPPPTPSPPPVEPPPTPPPPVTTQAPPPPAPTPPPAPAFNSATCRATPGAVAANGVSAKDLTMRGTADAWTACARSSIKERPAGPIAAKVHLQFSDSRAFRGATCAGCPAPLAACVASSTGRTVSLQFKSGDVTGDPSFDVGVTFTCD